MSRLDEPRFCAATGCKATVEPKMLMCKAHWFSVPKPVRDEVWAAWRAYQRAEYRVMPREQYEKLGARYRDAVQAAKDHAAKARPTTASAMGTDAVASTGATVVYRQGRLL